MFHGQIMGHKGNVHSRSKNVFSDGNKSLRNVKMHKHFSSCWLIHLNWNVLSINGSIQLHCIYYTTRIAFVYTI